MQGRDDRLIRGITMSDDDPDGDGERAAVDAAVTGALRRIASEAVAAAGWAGGSPNEEVFLAYLAARLPPGATLEEVLQIHASDLYLACGCALGVPAALASFEREIMPEVEAALRRLRLTPQTLDDLRQGVREKVLVGAPPARPRIVEYSGRGSLRGWTRVVATRVGLNALRGTGVEAPSEDHLLDRATQRDDPELIHLQQTYGPHVRVAFGQAMEALTPPQRVLLRQHFVDGLTPEQIGRLYRRHRVTIARRIEGTLKILRTRLRRLLERRLDCSRATAHSIVNLVFDQVEVSLHRHLTAHPNVEPPARRPAA